MRVQKLPNPSCDRKDTLAKKGLLVLSSEEINNLAGEISTRNTIAATEPSSLVLFLSSEVNKGFLKCQCHADCQTYLLVSVPRKKIL